MTNQTLNLILTPERYPYVQVFMSYIPSPNPTTKQRAVVNM